MPHASLRPASRHYVSSLRRFDRDSQESAPRVEPEHDNSPESAEEIRDRAANARIALLEWHAERSAKPIKLMNPVLASAIASRDYDRAMANIRSIRHDPKYRHARIRPGYREAMPPGPPAA